MSLPEGIERHDVDGVPVYVGPPSDGQWLAGLVFRVGRADETLPMAGVSHLIEHLALHGRPPGQSHFNGTTSLLFTHFYVGGDEADVVSYLNDTCANLRSLPLSRLATEKDILRTEAENRGTDAVALYRYGARTYGLTGYQEYGLYGLTPDAVRWWADQNFTAGNAAVWIAGDRLPEGLDLRLPPGPRRRPPVPTSALDETPAYFQLARRDATLQALIPRSTPSVLYTQILATALHAELRVRDGVSYSAHAEYSPRDADTATVGVIADALPDKVNSAASGMLDVLARLRWGTIGEDELATAKASQLRAMAGSPAQLLPGVAMDDLLGRPQRSMEELRAEVEQATMDDVRAVAEQAWTTALAQVPGRGLAYAGFAAAPRTSPQPIGGIVFQPLDDGTQALVIGENGVANVAGSESEQFVVPFDQTAVMLASPDGARHLTGFDGFGVSIEPGRYALPPQQLAYVDARVPPQVVVRMPPRDPERIPHPVRLPIPPTQLKAPPAPEPPLTPEEIWTTRERVLAIRWAADPRTFVPSPASWVLAAGAPYMIWAPASWDRMPTDNVDQARKLLIDPWGIHSRTDLLKDLYWLLTRGHRDQFAGDIAAWSALGEGEAAAMDAEIAQWSREIADEEMLVRYRHVRTNERDIRHADLAPFDLMRFLMLCRHGAAAGYLSEEEAWDFMLLPCHQLQVTFSGWEHLFDHFARGRWFWFGNAPDEDAREWVRMDHLHHTLFKPDTGPWARVPWNLPLPPCNYWLVDALLRERLLVLLEPADRPSATSWEIAIDQAARQRLGMPPA